MKLSSKSKLWLVLTIALGILTSLLVSSYLKEVKAAAEKQVVVSVTVAAKKIPQWTRISEDMLKTVQLPEKSLPEKAVSQPPQAVGQFATAEINPEEVITFTKIASEKTSSDLVYKIPAGCRAITIAVNPIVSVGGQIKPGNRVDLLMTYNITGTIPDTKVLTLVQNSLVLAVGGGA
ncbi:MAG TPA: Flp pilus assembly protein CpaB, partial [Desulfobacteria bacterium]|nr:Flp pilus assembly protein CpaB [Desulfobacteria bacterium]